ncbi:MAG: biopolymer transporter ExbD [Planctomycetota bacterium]
MFTTSFIDIVFLLLIFFLVTATFQKEEDRLSSALESQSDSGGSGADLLPQIIDVRSDDSGPVFSMGERAMRSQDELIGLLASLPKGPGVFVRVHGSAPVHAVASALQACRDAGFVRISYVPAN